MEGDVAFEVVDDVIDVVVFDANHGEVVTTDVNVADKWVMDAVDGKLNDVVSDDVVTLKMLLNC